MACMEHECEQCGYTEFNNKSRSPGCCPKCGGDMRHTFDEPPEREED